MVVVAAEEGGGVEYQHKSTLMTVGTLGDIEAPSPAARVGEVPAHLSLSPPASRSPAAHAVTQRGGSFDIAGTHSGSVLATTTRFRDGNPELCKAVLSALQQAAEFIETSPGAAAEIFAGMASGNDIPPEDLADMIGDPDLAYAAAPAGIMRIAGFMHRTGRLHRRPADWRELFLPESRDLAGS